MIKRKLVGLLAGCMLLTGCAGRPASNGLPLSTRSSDRTYTTPAEATSPTQVTPANSNYLLDLTGCQVFTPGRKPWEVGKDLPEGDYALVPWINTVGVDNTYSLTIASDSEMSQIVEFRMGKGCGITHVQEGDFVKVSFCVMVPLDQCPQIGLVDGIYPQGSYLVGRHIPAGIYTVRCCGESGTYGIYDGLRAGSVVTADTLEAGQSRQILLVEDTMLVMNGCEIS